MYIFEKINVFDLSRTGCLRPAVILSFCLGNLGFIHPGAVCQSSDDTPVTLSYSGWTITADPGHKYLTLYHDSLGILLEEIILNSRRGDDLKPIMNWNAVNKEGNRLFISTSDPASAWIFELNQDNIIISGTSSGLYLSAKAPASAERVVARLLDPEGVPVLWGTSDEIVNRWNGKETQNLSRLPSGNPDVMTFALGQVSSANLHSLFDRRKDIAIDFPESTHMKRNQQDQDLLDISIPVPGKAMIKLIPDYYTRVLGLPVYSRFDDSFFPTAPLIWGSWTAYYYQARESDIVSNTDWLSANLKPYGFQYVQLDDGYDRGKNGEHYWIENWDTTLFPHGPAWLAGYIKSKGLHPGLWLVPNAYSGFFSTHPEWYIYDRAGNVIEDYHTPALDHTNPAVQEWLVRLFSTLRGWGFEYFKFDGETSIPMYAPDLDAGRLYDKSVDPFTAYRGRLKLIRSIIGPETFIEGCNAGAPLNGVGYFNSCFNGADMYNNWKGHYAVFSSINANAFLNHMLIYVMPGEGIDVSPLMGVEEAKEKMAPRALQVVMSREDPFTGFGTTLAEARTLVSVIALTGVVYPLTSIMPWLPEERVRLLKMTMPTLPILPVDLFSRGSDMVWDKFKHTTPDAYIHDYPEIIDLKVNAASGVYDVAGLVNWRGEKIARYLSFSDKLGLEAGVPYVVFDFWNQELLGVYRDSINIDIEPHDTRVLLIHARQDRPQLIGISRHISGVCSILGLNWADTEKILSGTSETIKGDVYSLFIYVPDGMNMKAVSAVTGDGQKISVTSVLSGNLLKISVEGRGCVIQWQIKF